MFLSLSKEERNLRLLYGLSFLFTFKTYEGVLAIYFAYITGSFTTGMTVFAVMRISASILEIPTGLFSDSIGRKKTLILHYLAALGAITFYYFATSLTFLAVGAIFTGLSIAMGSGAISAYVYENLKQLNRVSDFKRIEGKRLAIKRYSLVVAGIIGTIIIFFFNIEMALLVTLIIRALSLPLVLLLQDVDIYEKKKANVFSDLNVSIRYFKENFSLRNIGFGRMITRGLGNVEYRFRALFFNTFMPEWVVNLLGILNNLVSGVSMQITHIVVERIGVLRAIVYFDVLHRIAIFILVLMNTITGGILMNIITSIGYGLRVVAVEDLLQARYSHEQRATMGSIVGLGESFIYGVSAIIIGISADQVGLLMTMLSLQPILLLGAFFYYRGITYTK